jgi:hypothetical protein
MKRVWLIALVFLTHCAAQEHVETPHVDAREQQVRDIIARMWTPDKEVVRDAIEDSEAVRDERIVESLIGAMWTNIVGHDPSYYLVDLMIHALKAQGLTVELDEEGYRLRWPESEYTEFVPYRIGP